VPASLSGTTGRCPGCKASVPIDYDTIKTQEVAARLQSPKLNPISIAHEKEDQAMEYLRRSMTLEEFKILAVASMTPIQRKTLMDWGLFNFGLGQHLDSSIDKIKFDGRLIILEDGSEWEVDSSDAYTADNWIPGDRVVVIDDEMFRIEDAEKVDVQKYDD
jgi:hypothetical protein